MTLTLVRRSRLLDLDTFSRAGGAHPDLVRRLVALGLLEPEPDATGALRFAPAQLITLARIQRLRVGLGLNYAAIGVVMDLLDRVSVLEHELRQATYRPAGGRPWT